MDPGPNSLFYQRARAGLTAVTSNGKSRYDVICACIYWYCPLRTTSQMNGLGPKQSIFISHTSKLVIELLVKNELILF